MAGSDYVLGFKDAVEMFTNETNNTIESIKDNSPDELTKAIDSFISTTYVTNLHADKLEDDMLISMEEEMNCSMCDIRGECDEFNQTTPTSFEQFVNNLFKEEF